MRRLRIVPWRRPGTGIPGFTLVEEWFDDKGHVTRDSRNQMTNKEFKGLLKSAKWAKKQPKVEKKA